MSENGISRYSSTQEQLDELRRLQAEDEQIYRRKMELGELGTNPASVQALAKTILARKKQIEMLEYQIEDNPEIDVNTGIEIDSQQPLQETALTEYHRNPVIRWFQRAIERLERFKQKLDDRSSELNETREIPDELKTYRRTTEEYTGVAEMDFSQDNTMQPNQVKKSWELTPEQLKQVREATNRISEKYRQQESSLSQIQETEIGQDDTLYK